MPACGPATEAEAHEKGVGKGHDIVPYPRRSVTASLDPVDRDSDVTPQRPGAAVTQRGRGHAACSVARAMTKFRARTLTVLTVLTLTVAAAPRSADACGVPESGLTGSIPATGQSYPANAALVFEGHGISLTDVTVTIDGAPATLVEVEHPGLGLAAKIQPLPLLGQDVVVSGDFCEFEDCEPEVISFVAGPPDHSAPGASEVMFAVFDHGGFVSSGGDCMSDSDLAFYVHASVGSEAAGQAPVRYRMSFPGALGGLEVGGLFTGEGPNTRAFSITDAQLADDVVTDLCLYFEVIDLAGNNGSPSEVCRPCFFRSSDEPAQAMVPAEPVWTDADVVAGSACAGPGETESDTDTDTSGSDASTDGDSTGDATTGAESPTTGEFTTYGETTHGGGDGSDNPGLEEGMYDKSCDCRSDDTDAGALAWLAGLLLLGGRRRR